MLYIFVIQMSRSSDYPTIRHAEDLIFRLRECFLVLLSPPALTIGEKWETESGRQGPRAM